MKMLQPSGHARRRPRAATKKNIFLFEDKTIFLFDSDPAFVIPNAHLRTKEMYRQTQRPGVLLWAITHCLAVIILITNGGVLPVPPLPAAHPTL